MKIYLSLRIKIAMLVILILNLILIFVGLIIINNVREWEINRLGKNIMDIAQTVAHNSLIAENIGKQNGSNIIQPIAESIRKQTQANFVVVIDMKGIRYSHPVSERLGKHVVGGDESRVLKIGESYISQAVGTLGPSLRAFVPIYRGSKQVGAVIVGMLMKGIEKRINKIVKSIYFALIFGDILGVIGSIFLANNVKKSIFGLEPVEIARLFQEKNAIINSIREGIVAIDKDNKITLINKEAKKILNCEGDPYGKDIREIIPTTRLPILLKTGVPEYNKEQIINGTVILTNRIPIKVGEEVIGAVASFNRKNEVQKLAEELTGVKKFVEALRSQNHEYLNNLHTISGLIQLGEYDKALKLISKVSNQKQELTSFLIKNIKANEIVGLLLGKFDRANELKIRFVIDPKSSLKRIPSLEFKYKLITIIGNLLENAMESFDGNNNVKKKEVYLAIFEKKRLC